MTAPLKSKPTRSPSRSALRSRAWSLLLGAMSLSFLSQAPALQAADPFPETRDDVLLQGFHWESSDQYPWWNVLQSKASDAAAAGFDMVWFPPSSRSADAAPEGYLPNELYTQSAAYGTQAQLQSAISAFHGKGVKVLADIVINHRVGTYNWADFNNPTWGSDAVCKGDEWSGATGNYDTGDGYSAARDIDHTQAYVRTSITDWMKWLKTTIGYDGWRYDYVKGYAGGYNGIYNDATAPYFSVGEYWTNLDLSNPNPHRQAIVNWIDATGGKSAAFDFTTKGILQQAVKYNEYWRLKDGQGKPSGLIGWWPALSVTFLDNHDTGPSTGGAGGQNHWPFPSDKVSAGYAYLLTHPGVPSVYWVHYYDWNLKPEIDKLLKLRTDQGLTSTSTVSIQVADSTQYASITDNKVALRLGNGSWTPGTGWTQTLSGSGYVIWTKSTTTPPTTSKVRTVVYIYKQTSPGQDIYIRGGHDANLVKSGAYASQSEPIRYLNTLNTTTKATKASDTSLDWNSDSALDWTCNDWPESWGTARYYDLDGYGEDIENTKGLHYWKFDVEMDGKTGDWFEFKAFLRQGSSTTWETDIKQSGTPYQTINHWAKKGMITVVGFGESYAEFYALK